MRQYPKNEHSHTHNTSIAGKLIRAQAEQISETPEEYVARKCSREGEDNGRRIF